MKHFYNRYRTAILNGLLVLALITGLSVAANNPVRDICLGIAVGVALGNFANSLFAKKLNTEQSVQVSDTTKLNSNSKARYLK